MAPSNGKLAQSFGYRPSHLNKKSHEYRHRSVSFDFLVPETKSLQIGLTLRLLSSRTVERIGQNYQWTKMRGVDQQRGRQEGRGTIFLGNTSLDLVVFHQKLDSWQLYLD